MSDVINSANLLREILDHSVAAKMNDEERHHLENDLLVVTDAILRAKLEEFDRVLRNEKVIAAE